MIWLFLALFIVSRYADIWSSRRAIYYGSHEGNKLFQDKYGQFSLVKFLILNGALGAGITIGSFYFDYFWIGFAPFILGSAIGAWRNVSQQSKNRENQIAFLRTIHTRLLAGATHDEVAMLFNNRLLITRNGRTWYDLFGWIHEDGEANAVADRLIRRLAEVAMKDEAAWFPA